MYVKPSGRVSGVTERRPYARAVERRPVTPDEELLGAERPAVATIHSEAERLERIRRELVAGFEALSGLGPAVSVWGSARVPEGHPHYELGRAVARRLGQDGVAIVTGGGPGVMEAANRGAREAGVRSVGLGIELPREQAMNPYVDLPLRFHYFFTRKVMFVRYACAFVALPGGFGTLDELFEVLTLIQTDRVKDFPVVVVGSDYWGGLFDWLRERVVADAKIEPGDLAIMTVSDDPDEVAALVREGAMAQGLA
jgi:uncharacterized protein (TIGR00730 family)